MSLTIEEGGSTALLGPNGANKTTLISTICGITGDQRGRITVGGPDVVRDYREAGGWSGWCRRNLARDFSRRWPIPCASRAGCSAGRRTRPISSAAARPRALGQARHPNPAAVGRHEAAGADRQGAGAPAAGLFLDEPTRASMSSCARMWEIVAELRANGTTIILTTHYIEEAEAIADRVGIINGRPHPARRRNGR